MANTIFRRPRIWSLIRVRRVGHLLKPRQAFVERWPENSAGLMRGMPVYKRENASFVTETDSSSTKDGVRYPILSLQFSIGNTLAKMVGRLRNFLRNLIYPGLDLHTRRRAALCAFWKTGRRDVLDAGSGNGYFSWLAYESGARVLALNVDQAQVSKTRDFLLGYMNAERERLQIEQFNLYDLPSMAKSFDEIICYEVLEHIRNDKAIVEEFYRILNPGGMLHLCCPYRLHDHHQSGPIDETETGGHVRIGYTENDYRALLEPLGFQIDTVAGIGAAPLYYADRFLRAIRNRWGDAIAMPFLPFLLPFVWFDRINPTVPFSLYVRAIKPHR